MIGVILRRSETQDESFLLKCLMADGTLMNFKIPGIKKSKRRSSYFYSPGCIRDFTWSPNHQDTVYVKEDTLVHSPVTENVTYEDLMIITEALFPTTFFQPSENLLPFFRLYEYAFSRWASASPELRQSFANTLMLQSLELFGYFHKTNDCEICGKEEVSGGMFVLDTGLICAECFSAQLFPRQFSLPQVFTHEFYDWNISDKQPDPGFQKEQREKIQLYLRNMFS